MTLLQRTGQLWKVFFFGAGLILGSLATLLQGFLYEPLGRETAMQIALGGVALIVGSFVWAGNAIRCPHCQLKIFFHALRHKGFLNWFAWLLQHEECPQCAFGRGSQTRRGGRKVKGLKRP